VCHRQFKEEIQKKFAESLGLSLIHLKHSLSSWDLYPVSSKHDLTLKAMFLYCYLVISLNKIYDFAT
jgi:hypothetical protein